MVSSDLFLVNGLVCENIPAPISYLEEQKRKKQKEILKKKNKFL